MASSSSRRASDSLAAALAGVLLLAAAPAVVQAEPCGRAARRDAQRHKRQAWKLRESDPSAAAEALEKAYAACPDPWYLGHLAIFYEKAGRIRDAISTLDRFIADPEAPQRDQAEEARARLRRKLARLRVVTDPPGARITVDGAPPEAGDESPTMAELDPGVHQVEASLGGFQDAREEVTLAQAEERTLELTLESLTPEPREPPLSLEEDEGEDEDEAPAPPPLVGTFSAQLGGGVAFPVLSEALLTAPALAVDVAGGLDLRSVRIELLLQLFVYPDLQGVVLEAGGGPRVGVRLGALPLYLEAEAVVAMSYVNVQASGLQIPEGEQIGLSVAPALSLAWRVIDLLELVARPIRAELLGLAGELTGGFAFRWTLDVGVRLRL